MQVHTQRCGLLGEMPGGAAAHSCWHQNGGQEWDRGPGAAAVLQLYWRPADRNEKKLISEGLGSSEWMRLLSRRCCSGSGS